MKTKAWTWIGLALLVAAIHGGGCRPEPYIGGDIDELALGVPAVEAQGERETYGEPRYWGDRFRDEPAPTSKRFDVSRLWGASGLERRDAAPLKASTSSRVKAWWARLVAAIRAALAGDDDTPADPVTPPVEPPVTPPDDPPGDVTPPAQTGDNSFLWKPVSDTDGNLVVILPANINASTVTVNGLSPSASIGRWNGNRQHFRYPKPGASYGVNVKVVAVGTGRAWTVPNGGARWDAQ